MRLLQFQVILLQITLFMVDSLREMADSRVL
jgi:hypothetical protein